MADASELLLVAAVATVGVLHTIVPDHWVPITLMARQRGWSRAETARVAFKAGIGHIVSTLAIAVVIWLGGIAVATRFGQWVDTIASLALIGFGGWIAISAWREIKGVSVHSHRHEHGHTHTHAEESGSVNGHQLKESDTEPGAIHHHGDQHSGGPEKIKGRTALVLILGSSPMVEGIPAFFAAGKYGVGLIVIMSVVFAATTIATYVLLCACSTAGLQRVSLGPLERYGEVISGGFIALVGIVFWIWPIL